MTAAKSVTEGVFDVCAEAKEVAQELGRKWTLMSHVRVSV